MACNFPFDSNKRINNQEELLRCNAGTTKDVLATLDLNDICNPLKNHIENETETLIIIDELIREENQQKCHSYTPESSECCKPKRSRKYQNPTSLELSLDSFYLTPPSVDTKTEFACSISEFMEFRQKTMSEVMLHLNEMRMIILDNNYAHLVVQIKLKYVNVLLQRLESMWGKFREGLKMIDGNLVNVIPQLKAVNSLTHQDHNEKKQLQEEITRKNIVIKKVVEKLRLIIWEVNVMQKASKKRGVDEMN